MPAALEEIEEFPEEDQYLAELKVRNTGSVPLEDTVAVYAVFRDSTGTFQGYGWQTVDRPIPAGKTYLLKVDVGINTAVPFDPFDYLDGLDYTVDLVLSPFLGGVGINC